MKILKVYKELRDVLIIQNDDGNLVVRAMYEDEGSPEEQEVIRQVVGSPGFEPKNVQKFETTHGK